MSSGIMPILLVVPDRGWCMLKVVDPLLRRIEALSEDGYYALGFLMGDGHERSMVVRLGDNEVDVPEANLIEGWARTSASFRAAVTAVRAVDQARKVVGPRSVPLRDVPGGWDVSLGNVTLSETGQPVCVAHGELALMESATYQCPSCGALARYGDTS
jgi:hypothetical protein